MMNDIETVAPAPGFSPLPGESVRALAAFGADSEPGPRRRWVAAARKVGASRRTVQRWAADFDWRGRIQSHAARSLEPSARLETAARKTAARRAALAEAQQPEAALQRLLMSPFVHFRHFQNRVPKGAKKGQKVPKSDIGSFPPSMAFWFPVGYSIPPPSPLRPERNRCHQSIPRPRRGGIHPL